MKRKFRLLFSTLLLLTLTLFLISCGGNDEGVYTQDGMGITSTQGESAPRDEDYRDDYDNDSMHRAFGEGSISGDKIIYRQSLSMETDNLQETLSKMEQRLDRYGGHIHRYQIISYEEDFPRGDFTLRIPSESLKGFVDDLRGFGVFTQEVLESDDVSETYYDLEANLRNQTIQERRLLDLLEDAQSLSDILTLESELSRIRREIEGLQGSLNRLDDQVRFSTVYLSLRQVPGDPLEEDNCWDQFLENFRDSFERFYGAMQSILLWFAANFPFVLLVGVIFSLILKFYPRGFKKLKGKGSSEKS